MKNLKKLVSVIVTVAMLVSSFAALSVSAAGEYGDVDATNSYYKAIKVLSGLGVVKGDEEGNFNPTNDIKRSEMVTLVCRALGEEAVAQSSGGASFDDVSADHWAAGYIAWGVAGNIVNGVGDNKFDPDAPVKFQDAVVMVLRALGYERIAQRAENGGYPTGYLKVASQRGVLYGTSFDGATAATREVVAQVIYNALTTPLVDVSYYAPNPEDDEYVVYDGRNGTDLRTLLTWTNEIYKVKATVEDTAKVNENLRTAAGDMVKLNVINTYDYAPKYVLDGVIADPTYGLLLDPAYVTAYIGETEIADYFGYTVEAYIYENDDEDWEVLAVVVDSKSTVSETVSDNFDSYTVVEAANPAQNKNGKAYFEYLPDLNSSKTTRIELTANATIYYNGQYLTNVADTGASSLSDLLVNFADSITFMGPRNDLYNKVFVTDYTYRQVEAVKAEEEYIQFTANGGVSLNVEDRKNDKFTYGLYDAEGNAITLEDIQEDDILNIVCPLYANGTRNEKAALDKVSYMDIYVTNETVEGSVTEQIDADTFRIDGEEYAVTSDCQKTIKVGDEGIFYITIDGSIYNAEASSAIGRNFSLILNAGHEESFSVKTYQIKLFTSEGTIDTYNVASSLKVYEEASHVVNGQTVYTWDATVYKRENGTDLQYDFFEGQGGLMSQISATTEAAAKAQLPGKVVLYKLNSNNEISELRFAGSYIELQSKPVVNAKYYDDTKIFGGEDIDDNSKLFVAPVTLLSTVNGVDKWGVDEDDVELASFSSLDEDEQYNGITLFKFDDDDYLGAAVSDREVVSAMKKSHLAVVKSVSTGLDAEGFNVAKYTFVQSGEVITKAVDNDADTGAVHTLSVGDVFRYAVNGEDEIKKTQLIVDASVAATAAANGNVAGFNNQGLTEAALQTNDIAIVYGKVTEIKGGKMIIAGTNTKYSMNETEGNTYAFVDGAKINSTRYSASAVSVLSGPGYIKEDYNDTYEYFAVAIIGETGRYEDIVEFEFAQAAAPVVTPPAGGTTTPPAGDDTTGGDDTTTPPAGDDTTGGDDTTTPPAGDDTTGGDDTTTPPAGDDTTSDIVA